MWLYHETGRKSPWMNLWFLRHSHNVHKSLPCLILIDKLKFCVVVSYQNHWSGKALPFFPKCRWQPTATVWVSKLRASPLRYRKLMYPRSIPLVNGCVSTKVYTRECNISLYSSSVYTARARVPLRSRIVQWLRSLTRPTRHCTFIRSTKFNAPNREYGCRPSPLWLRFLSITLVLIAAIKIVVPVLIPRSRHSGNRMQNRCSNWPKKVSSTNSGRRSFCLANLSTSILYCRRFSKYPEER